MSALLLFDWSMGNASYTYSIILLNDLGRVVHFHLLVVTHLLLVMKLKLLILVSDSLCNLLLLLLYPVYSSAESLQCFDTVGWVAGRASGL